MIYSVYAGTYLLEIMRLNLVFALCLCSLVCFAQVGIKAGYGQSNFDMWLEAYSIAANTKDKKIFNGSQFVALDYWFRLPKRRVEFLPQIGISRYTSTPNSEFDFRGISFDAAFNVNVYFLDLEEDCDCPTFSKQGGLVKKGLFLNVAPLMKSFSFTGENVFTEAKINKVVPGLKFGLGLDIGVNDIITISPLIGYELTTMMTWDNMSSILTPATVAENIASNYNKQFAEIRLGLRFDQKNKFRRR
jgi:hypothetical protein